MAISTNGTVLARLAGALYNTQMSNATYKEVASLDPSALANTLYARDFSSSTDLAVATTLVTNLGLTSVTGLANWVAAQLTAAGSAKGAKVVDLLNSFAQMTSDTTYGTYATAFNTKVDAALALSQTTDNAGGTFAAAGVVVVAGKSFALTAGLDTFAGSSVADAITATQATFQAGDVLNGGDGVDTLTITDSGSAAWTLPTGASVTNIENIRLKNVNSPSASAAGNAESATFVFKDLAAGQTVSIAGVTFTAGSSGATAAQVAAAFVSATITGTTAAVAGGVLTDTATGTAANADTRAEVTALLAAGGYTAAAGTAVPNSVVFTSNAATNANVMDLVPTGTAITGRPQITVLTIGTSTNTAGVSFTANGATVLSAAPAAANAGANSTVIANAINAYYGSTIAVADTTAATVTITSPTPLALSGFAATNFVVTSYALSQSLLAASAPTVTITQGVAPTSAGTSTDTIDASKFVGATSFVNDSSTGDVTYSSLASTQSVTIEGNGAVTNGATSATWTTATSPTLNVINGTKAGNVTVVANAASKITLTSSGAALTTTGLPGTNTVGTVNLGGLSTSTLDIKADSNIGLSTGATFTTAAKAITVSGAATSVNLGAGSTGTTAISASNLESIDASGMTAGGVVVALTTGTKSFAGGAGNDTVATAAFTNTGVVVDAGAGTGDTLIIAAATDLDTTSEAAVYKNFETVRAASGSFDASLVPTATSIQMTGAGTLSNLTAPQAANVQIRASGAYTASLKDSTGSADVLTLKLGTGSTTDAATSISTGLTANGFETINLQTNAGSTSTVGANKISTIAAFTADKATAINLSGNSFVLSNIATTKAVTIDGSALTGDGQATPVGFTVAGNAVVGSTVIGSAFADTFTLGTVGSTYNAGAGNDTIKSTVANLLSSAVYNTVDAGAGVDTLNITNGAASAVTMVDNTFRNLSGVEKITVDSTTSSAISITTGGWFDKSFAATGAEITGTTTTGTFTVDASTFTGALKVTATTVGTGTTEGAVAITTGYGNDTVVVSNASAGGDGAISTGAGSDTVTGGGDADVITGGTGADVMAGGAGADTFVFAAGDSGLPSDTNFDTITDFTTNSDIISLGAYTIVTYTSATAGTASISSSGIATFQTADVTLAQRIAATENGINAGGTATAGQTAVFQYLNDAYIFVSDGVDGVGANDRLIKLVGIDTTATATDVVTAVSAGSTFTLA